VPTAHLPLETERLRLRPYREDDLDDLFAILGDAETMRYYPKPFTREESLAWIAKNLDRYRRDGFGLWAIESRDTGEFLGNCGPVRQMVDGWDEVELGWHVRRSHWRQGIATEAAATCRDHAFTTLGLDRLISLIRPENLPSRGVAEKIGMTVEKRVEWASLPHLVYTMTRDA
jgi:[ribosomal protein S5]-alanine N-acetyltransferase